MHSSHSNHLFYFSALLESLKPSGLTQHEVMLLGIGTVRSHFSCQISHFISSSWPKLVASNR